MHRLTCANRNWCMCVCVQVHAKIQLTCKLMFTRAKLILLAHQIFTFRHK